MTVCACLTAYLMLGPLASTPEVRFEKYQVDPTFWSEGVAVADINQDGKTDIFAGDVWYETKELGKWEKHELRPPRGVYDGTKGYSNSFANFAHDVNGDGWVDVIIVGFPGEAFFWYENPKNQPGHWKEHFIWRSACNETPIFTDLLGDGKPGVILGYKPEGQIGYFRPGKDPTKPWEPLPISKPDSPGTERYWHGLGAGDVNKDGRLDVIINVGWWEQPADSNQTPWPFHPLELNPPKKTPSDPVRENRSCADIHVYDVDGDGDNDFISSAAHTYGIWWFENVSGNTADKVVPHTIRADFSQTHALHLVDINEDGSPDLVTGKRYFAHQGNDPGGKEPVVFYWIEMKRTADGKVEFVSHLIDEGAGHGTQFTIADFDLDGHLDIITSNKKGTHVFIQKR